MNSKHQKVRGQSKKYLFAFQIDPGQLKKNLINLILQIRHFEKQKHGIFYLFKKKELKIIFETFFHHILNNKRYIYNNQIFPFKIFTRLNKSNSGTNFYKGSKAFFNCIFAINKNQMHFNGTELKRCVSFNTKG